MTAKLRAEFPFINHTKLRTIVYATPKHRTIKIGSIIFDRHTYQTKKHLVLDALARDAEALKVIGHLRKLINRQRAQYYPYFNRTLTRKEIQEIETAKQNA